jgi:3-oxoadipate enol-lactonase
VPFAVVDGGRLWYDLTGNGAPVVLIHSGLADARQWDDQVESFSKRFTVLRFDQRGYGRSDRITGPYAPVDDATALLDELGLGAAALVGVSQGAGIALAVALDRPDLVRALVLAAPGAVGWPEWSEETTAADQRVDAAIAAGRRVGALDAALDLWLPPGRFPDTDTRVRQLLAENLDPWFAQEWERWPEASRLARLDRVAVPTLVILAEHDVPEIQDAGRALAGGIAGAELATIPGTDHLVNLRNPEGFDHVVHTFLVGVIG